jgi:diacylglycerol kinase (ATP)
VAEAVHVILNPAASNGGGARLAPRLVSRLESRSIPHEIFRSTGAGHVAELARAAAERGASTILVAGGDGTIHDVVHGLLSTSAPPPPVAILPVGTGNDFFRMVGKDRGIPAAIDLLEKGRVRWFDVGHATWDSGSRHFVNLLGIGIDVEVLRKRESFQRLPGLAQYLAALLSALVRFRPVPVKVTIDRGQVIEEDALLCAVTVGPSVGGGFMLAPDALPDDGLLDLCLVGRLSLTQILRYIPRVIRGRHKDLDMVSLVQFRNLRLDAGEGRTFSFELDGELMQEEVSFLEVEMRAGCLPILVPEGTGIHAGEGEA